MPISFRDEEQLAMPPPSPSPKPENSPWSLSPTPECGRPRKEDGDYIDHLLGYVLPPKELEKHGYTTKPLTDAELLQRRRCQGCNKTMAQISKWKPPPSPLELAKRTDPSQPKAAEIYDAALRPPPPPPLLCKYHPGHLINGVRDPQRPSDAPGNRGKVWTCCAQPPAAPPCGGVATHIPRDYALGELEDLYQFTHTPTRQPRSADRRAAVAIDCEMGTAVSGDNEVIRITLIDYFTDEILIDSLVEPDVPMSHCNTKYSGVTFKDIREAKRERRCLLGRHAAMRQVWRFVGPQTVVVGHGASSDLRVLRWLHTNVVDSQIIEGTRMKKKKEFEEAAKKEKEEKEKMVEGSEDALVDLSSLKIDGEKEESVPAETRKKKPKGSGDLALKTLAKRFLKRDIQMGGQLGHDSLEDAVAAKDVVHYLIHNPPE